MNAPACVAIFPATSLIGAQQRQPALVVDDSLIGDAARAGGHQALGEVGLCGKVQVR